MGISSDGILIYGIAWDDEIDEVFSTKDARAFLEETGEGYGDGREFFEREGFQHLEYGIHCSYEYQMPMVFVKGKVMRASRGYPKSVEDLVHWSIPSPAVAELQRFIEMVGVESKPVGWYLTSIYG